jgi:hypothetical protein
MQRVMEINDEGIVHSAQPSTRMALKILKYQTGMMARSPRSEANEPHRAVITVAGQLRCRLR